MMAHWYAVYTRPCWEKKVADALLRRKFECYLPLNKVYPAAPSADRRRPVYQPVFESCVFFRTTEDRLPSIRQVDGVLSMFYWHNKPAVIRDIEIDMMRRFLAEHQTVQLQKAVVNTTEIVKVVNGQPELLGIGGLTLRKVKLTLPSLGYIMETEVREEAAISIEQEVNFIETSVVNFG